jgi:PAS domain-containing protein
VQTTQTRDRGLLCLVPIYRYGLPRDTPEQRRAAAIGWSFATLFINDVMDGSHLLSDEFAITISDRTAMPADTFFSTPYDRHAGPDLQRNAPFNVFGREWELETRALPPFFERLNLVNPAFTASTVLVLCLLATSLLYLHLAGLSRRESAWRERSRLASMVAESSEAIMGISMSGEVTDWNPAAERLFGYTASEALGRGLANLIVPRTSQERTRRRDPSLAGNQVRGPIDDPTPVAEWQASRHGGQPLSHPLRGWRGRRHRYLRPRYHIVCESPA